MPTNLYFDAHIHSSLKCHFATPKDNPTADEFGSPWKVITSDDLLEKVSNFVKNELRPLVESSLASQSTLTQIKKNHYKLVINALFYPDRGLLNLVFNHQQFSKLIEKGKFGNILDFDQLTKLAKSSPFAILQKDLELLKLKNLGGESVVFLENDDFESDENSAIQMVFSIEGLHCLRNNFNTDSVDNISTEILNNLDSLIEEKIRVLFINLTHIDDSNDIFSNQCYGVDGFRIGGFDDVPLRPKSKGLTEAGKKMALKLAERNILADIKHMSYMARKQYYDFRKSDENKAFFENIPVICSHSGFTGTWFNKHGESITDFILVNNNPSIQNGIALAKGNPYLSDNRLGFNVSTVNLFNEDIEEILFSGGIIGLSLDQRVLGFSEVIDRTFPTGDTTFSNTNVIEYEKLNGRKISLLFDVDFISPEERAVFFEFRQNSRQNQRLDKCVIAKSRGNKANAHAQHFYLHIVHAIEIARFIGTVNDLDAEDLAKKMLLEVLCIGSDFDGLIDGLDSCPNMDSIGAFRIKFENEFGDFLNSVGKSLPAGVDIQQIAEHIFFKNGVEFVRKRLQIMNTPVEPIQT